VRIRSTHNLNAGANKEAPEIAGQMGESKMIPELVTDEDELFKDEDD
jgi:hypothetical protein